MGYRVLDPETRAYRTCYDLYFHEDFSHRHDALRQHDRRRELLKRGIDQPLFIDDHQYDPFCNPQAVRNMFYGHNTAASPLLTSNGVPSSEGAVESQAGQPLLSPWRNALNSM
jgi:hypothetical protein